MSVDLFEMANNHLWQTEFGFKQWTGETVPEFLEIERDGEGFTEWGWIDFGFQTYYALLNCGFRLRVSAGTASGVHPVQLGFSRVYVHLTDGFDYDQWINALNAGHSFVSTGPMLEVKFNGKDPGTRFEQFNAGESIRVTGIAHSRRPLDRIEVVVNGRVVHTVTPNNSKTTSAGLESPFDASLPINSSSWIVVRCFEIHPPQRIRFAHTNPVHIDIPNEPLRPRRQEVQYFIDRVKDELARNADVLDDESLAEYRHALRVYETIAETALDDGRCPATD